MVDTPPPSAPPSSDITPVAIEEEMRRSYLDYAMSVIVSRALPDVRDGLKPVHRRILYAMKESGNDWNRAYRKCARIVGDVMGAYHPHGDLAIYDALVRMAQGFSMEVPLIDGQGNFGSMDGDPPAAMRYTEARLSRAADALLDDIDKNTVDFQPNYDGRQLEPRVLPARFPNILVNGGSGIAVGMATNIPTHNLGEVIDACCAFLDNPQIGEDELMELVPGPDFPTGGIIVGRAGIHAASKLGRGSIVLRGRHHIEEIRKDRDAIVFTEIPYQVNKSRLLERLGETVREKIIEGIAEVRDESDRDGVRVVIELKRDAMADVVLNQLYRFTPLQSSFPVNSVVLDNGRPVTMSLREIIAAFIAFREEVVTRRTVFLLEKARGRARILVGLLIAVANIDAVIALIRAAPDPASAQAALMARAWPAETIAAIIARFEEQEGGSKVAPDGSYRLSEEQARAILDLRLQRLTGLERGKIAEELDEIVQEILGHLEILGSRSMLISVMRKEFVEIKERFARPRQTEIQDIEFETDIEDLIQREDMVVTVSHGGYIKRVPLSTYRAQRRGGRGRAGMETREEDFVSQVFVASTHAPMLFFTATGRVYKLKVYRLPVGTPHSRGKAMINLLPNLGPGEGISTVMVLPEDEKSWDSFSVVFATANGYVRRNALADFGNVQSNGKIAMKFEGEDADDRMIAAAVCSPEDDVLLATRSGKCIRFALDDVRVFSGRSSVGVRGIKLLGEDRVISLSILKHVEASTEIRRAYLAESARRRRDEASETEADMEKADDAEDGDGESAAMISEEQFNELGATEEFLLSVTAKGFGVRSSAYDYRITGRGGQGIVNMNLTPRRDAMVGVFPVGHRDQIILVTDSGMMIRVPVDGIRIARRGTQGVVVFKVGDSEQVVSVAHLSETEAGGSDNAGNGNDPGGDAEAPERGEDS